MGWRSRRALAVALALLAGCGAQAAPSAPLPDATSTAALASLEPAAAPAPVEPAPGSDSVVYAPNPAAIVVAIDPGHGGCLDWGVPDPSQRGVQLAEKTMALEIASRLRDMLETDGVRVVMTRDGDHALAGDDHPPLDCHGPSWRDVNGDGYVGFGEDLPKGTRTRDELQARLDLANLAQADALVSIHVNSPSEEGETIEVAFSQAYYSDERPWSAATARLAEGVQSGVVTAVGSLASYDRGDRGITAHNLYLVAPPLEAATQDRPNPLAQPARGGLMPVVLAEVGSITVGAEHDLLASAEGQDAVASGIFAGLSDYLGNRPLAARISLADVPVGREPEAAEGDGPPFWAAVVEGSSVSLRLTNSGNVTWPPGSQLVSGWEATEDPYLRSAPSRMIPLGADVPALAPGESVLLTVSLGPPTGRRSVAWISLWMGETILSDEGSPALQVSTQAP